MPYNFWENSKLNPFSFLNIKTQKLIEDTIDMLEDLIPSNRFHSTKNQSKRKRKNKNRPLINLNQDSDSDLENESEHGEADHLNQVEQFKCNQTTAIKYDTSNQNLKNSLTNATNKATSNSSHSNSNLNNSKSNNQCSSLIDCQMNDELILDNEIVLIDLTCFEKPQPICNRAICCQLIHTDCFKYLPESTASDVQSVLF